ncbi:hypothetical protein [Glycomyces sp. NPDC048151]|uniref:hypothetical protein n=1 Tax=Glycomyces sp. NPDC048151 TaxID=3364002 RepID=UPI003723A62D
MKSLSRRQINKSLLAIPGVALVGSAAAALVASPAAAASTKGGSIGTTEIVNRAKNWLSRDIQYSQTNYATDVEGNDSYRTDCSGMISMAWHATDNSFWTGSNWGSIASTVSKGSMRPGDALITTSNGHAVMFMNWIDKAAGKFKFIHMSNPNTDMVTGTGYTGGNISSYSAGSYTAWRYDKSFDDTVAVARDWNMQMLVNSVSGSLEHKMRFNSGSWGEGFGYVEGQSGDQGVPAAIAAAGMYDDLHVVIANGDDTVTHCVRDADGSWTPFRNVEGQVGSISSITSIAATSAGSQLHVVAVCAEGLRHTFRNHDGSWQESGWGNVENAAGTLPGTKTKVAATRIGTTLHVVVVAGGYVRHCSRTEGGDWSAWGNVENVAGEIGTITDVAVAGVNGEIQIIAQTSANALYHTLRNAAGSWQNFIKLSDFSSFVPESISMTEVDDDMQFAIVTSSGSIKHTIRYANGSWQESPGTVSLSGLSGGAAAQLAITGALD